MAFEFGERKSGHGRVDSAGNLKEEKMEGSVEHAPCMAADVLPGKAPSFKNSLFRERENYRKI